MPQGDDAAFIPCSRATNTKQTFCIEEQHIALNGQRVLLYLEDYQDYKAERYPHWLELLTTYYHEIAHMFVTYLAIRYKGRPKCRTPVACCTDYRDDVPESGFFVENHLFGGCFIRGRDTSGRANRFMVSSTFRDMFTDSTCSSLPFKLELSLSPNAYSTFISTLTYFRYCRDFKLAVLEDKC